MFDELLKSEVKTIIKLKIRHSIIYPVLITIGVILFIFVISFIEGDVSIGDEMGLFLFVFGGLGSIIAVITIIKNNRHEYKIIFLFLRRKYDDIGIGIGKCASWFNDYGYDENDNKVNNYICLIKEKDLSLSIIEKHYHSFELFSQTKEYIEKESNLKRIVTIKDIKDDDVVFWARFRNSKHCFETKLGEEVIIIDNIAYNRRLLNKKKEKQENSQKS